MPNETNELSIVISTKNYRAKHTLWGPLKDKEDITALAPENLKFYEDLELECKIAFQRFCDKSDENCNKTFECDECEENVENVYKVYIIPCAKKECDLKDKLDYLEKVLETVFDNSVIESEKVYLVAHDKDFDEDCQDVIFSPTREKQRLINSHKFLKKLVENGHIYLFQHQGGKLENIIDSICHDDDEKFTKEHCKELYYIIDENAEMIDFFRTVNAPNDDDKNIYNFTSK